MQAGGEHAHDDLVLAARLGIRHGLVAGRAIEGADDGGVHVSNSKVVRDTN